MTMLEWVASALGLVCVALAVRRSLWTYAFGVASTALLAIVVFEARLFSQAALQLFFVAINGYGFVTWRRARRSDGDIPVAQMSARERVLWAAATLAAALAWGVAMDRWAGAAQPFFDAGIAAVSVAAQLLMARRRWENWVLWIAVDLASIPLFLRQGLSVVAALYAVYLALAVWGLIDWMRAWRRGAGVPA